MGGDYDEGRGESRSSKQTGYRQPPPKRGYIKLCLLHREPYVQSRSRGWVQHCGTTLSRCPGVAGISAEGPLHYLWSDLSDNMNGCAHCLLVSTNKLTNITCRVSRDSPVASVRMLISEAERIGAHDLSLNGNTV